LKYRIDDLGWHGFERLMQSVLKAVIGPGITNWSGYSDRGKDAYCPTDLHFPERGILSPGPFIFQVKFVANANATGARSFDALEKAIRAEVKEIHQRVAKRQWKTPGSYVLITNAPMTPTQKTDVCEILREVAPNAKVYPLAATDVCDLLDGEPALRRAHPEILGLGDLQALIREAVSSSVLERSAASVREAEDLSRVFVATQAYAKTHSMLSRFGFVVLDGPPEMGKTAIARMVALSKVLDGWEAIECRCPDDVFHALRSDASQVFVADDALGRTEYNFSLGRQWELDLPGILRRIDERHWLIWTTRKHILARALSAMDLREPAEVFPQPSELVVDAADLSVEEKAHILYRHAKGARLEEDHKSLIREHARDIVKSAFFTPERIRRFVKEALPELREELQEGTTDREAVKARVEEAIQSPTKRMLLAFQALKEPHRSVLVDLLDCRYSCTADKQLEVYRSRHGDITEHSFREAVSDLLGTFLRERHASSLDWIHPSYRDVVIDTVSQDAKAQAEFLRTAGVEGLRLAFSVEGGETGSRRMPFMQCKQSWRIAADRITNLISGRHLASVVDIIHNAIADSRTDVILAGRVDALLASALDALDRYLKDPSMLSTDQLIALYGLYSLNEVRDPGFELAGYMSSRLGEIHEELQTDDPEIDSRLVEEVVALVNWVQRFEPETIVDPATQEILDPILEAFFEYASWTAEAAVDEWGEYDEEVDECERLSAAFNKINYGDIERADEIAHRLEWQASTYIDIQRPEYPYEDEDDIPVTKGKSTLDVDKLFGDL